jgi:hypothetical protein
MKLKHRKLKAALWSAAALAGFFQAWANRFYIEPDGLNYLDISYAYLHRDWPNAINAYWSPLYSWILAAAIGITRIPLSLESTLLHAVNIVLYLFALSCFAFFFDELTKWRAVNSNSQSDATTQSSAWFVWGYALFAYCELELIGVGMDTPDMLVSALFFLATALLFRMRHNDVGWLLYAAFGVTLALAYLAKAVMFPIAFVFLFCVSFAGNRGLRRLLRAGFALVIFLLVSSPWLFFLSNAKHQFTFGDTGRLNYAYYVNGLAGLPHWHGEIAGAGVPVHPTRRISDFPPVDEFATPIAGTYPPWYDATYWDEGVRPHFEARSQLKILLQSASEYFRLISAQRSFVVGFLVLLFFASDRLGFLRNLYALWTLWLPVVATFSLYSLVHVESRFLGAAVVISWCCIFASMVLPQSEYSLRVWRAVLLSVALILGVTVFKEAAGDLVRSSRASNLSWQVATELEKCGLQPGQRVAVLGHSTSSDYWAHLAQVRIVADLSEESVPSFWDASDATRARILESLAHTGASFVVTRFQPPASQISGWHFLGATGYYALPLSNGAKSE